MTYITEGYTNTTVLNNPIFTAYSVNYTFTNHLGMHNNYCMEILKVIMNRVNPGFFHSQFLEGRRSDHWSQVGINVDYLNIRLKLIGVGYALYYQLLVSLSLD